MELPKRRPKTAMVLYMLSTWLYIFFVGFLIMIFYLIHSLFEGEPAGDNPWGGLSFEWQTTSPPPTHNFIHDPVYVHGPYDYDKIIPEVTYDPMDTSKDRGMRY